MTQAYGNVGSQMTGIVTMSIIKFIGATAKYPNAHL